jgi:hypothetical protein
LKSKIMIVVGSLVVAGSLLTGYTTLTKAGESPTKVVQTTVAKAKADKPKKVIIERDADLKKYKIEVSEYNDLDSFVHDIAKNWKAGSEYRSVYADGKDAEHTLAVSTLQYVNYFENEIAARGMTHQFKELQKDALYLVTSSEKEFEELAKKFESKLTEIENSLSY